MLNLYKRILLLIVGLSLGSGIFISVWVGQVLHDRLDEEIGNRGTAITEALTEAVTKNIIAGDSISTLRTLQRVVARNEDIDHAFVVDFDGKLFAHTFEGQFPTHLERMNARWEDLPDQNDHQYTTSRGIIRHISHPLIEGAPGRLSVGFNKSGSAASIEETRREIIFIIFGIALIGAVLASFVGNRVSRPLNMLTETVAAYGRGEQANFGALRNRGGTPETTALRDAFKGMIEFREKSAVENTRLARIVEESLNEIYIFDAETLKFTKVNHGARKNLGYSMDEMRDMTAFDIKPEIGEEQFKEIIQPLKDGAEKQLVFETVHMRKDGSTYDVEVYLQLMREGESGAFVAIINDITERKASAAENERLGRIVEESLNEIYIFDAESLRFTKVNHGARRNLGYSMDELREMTPFDIKPDVSEEQFLEMIKPLKDGAQGQLVFETVHRRKDGTTYDVEIYTQFMREGGGWSLRRHDQRYFRAPSVGASAPEFQSRPRTKGSGTDPGTGNRGRRAPTNPGIVARK